MSDRIIELDGSSPPLIVRVAGYEYVFTIEAASDASFTLVETAPDGERDLIAGGSEW